MSAKNEVKQPKTLPSPLNNPMTNYAVYVMSAGERILYFLILLVAGGFAGMIFYGGLFKDGDGNATTATTISNLVVFIVVGLVANKFFIKAIRDSLKTKRDMLLSKQFMDLLEALGTSLSAGNTLSDAFNNAKGDLANQYNESDLIMVELNEILMGISNGHSIEEMIDDFGIRSGNEDIQNFSNVISNCFRLGGSFKDVVRRTREIISDKRAVADEIETKISSNKLQLNAMCLMPLILVGMLKLTNPSFAENLARPVGVIVTTVSIGLFIGAYFWGQKIIKIN